VARPESGAHRLAEIGVDIEMEMCVQRGQFRIASVVRVPRVAVLLGTSLWLLWAVGLRAQSLPEAPSALLVASRAELVERAQAQAENPAQEMANHTASRRKLPPCPDVHLQEAPEADSSQSIAQRSQPACREENPLQPIVSSAHVKPLTIREKGILAGRDIIDPFNLITIAGSSAITVAAQSHSAYGPGFAGFGRLAGYSLSEDIIGESLGTFAIPSLVKEDPRYHRMPGQPVPRRLLHAIAHTFVSQHDDGRLMPNYAILLTYPAAAEIFNLYVPGTQTDGPSTAQRIGVGIATNPAGDIIAEFLPDLAKRVHVRIVFVQQIMNQVAAGAPGVQ
jgi:hypothetical protein